MSNTADTRKHPRTSSRAAPHRGPDLWQNRGPHKENHPSTPKESSDQPQPHHPQAAEPEPVDEVNILASTFGTLLSSQGTDTHLSWTHTQLRGNPSNLRLPDRPVKSLRSGSSRMANQHPHTTRPHHWEPMSSAGASRRDRPPRGVRSSLPGGIENIRQPADQSQIGTPPGA
jgi:hypothetical protein